MRHNVEINGIYVHPDVVRAHGEMNLGMRFAESEERLPEIIKDLCEKTPEEFRNINAAILPIGNES